MTARVTVIASVLLIALTTCITFSRLTSAQFSNWDDDHTIVENPWLNPPAFSSLAKIWAHQNADLYIPVTYTTWWTLAKVSYFTGADGETHQRPAIFHSANILLHIATALFVFALLRKLFADVQIAAVGALLFALHPMQVEAVAWSSGTKDVLCGLLSATSMLFYVRYAQALGSAPPRELSKDIRRTATRWYVSAFVAFCLAILSKPTAMMVPLMLLAIELFMLRRGRAASARGVVPMLIFAAAGAITARCFQTPQMLTVTVDPVQRLPVALDALAFYLRKLVMPTSLTFDYGRNPRFVIDAGFWKYTMLVPIVIAGIIALLAKRVPALAAGALIFVMGLLPLLGFVRFDFLEYSVVTDHYLYLPMIGVAIALAGVLALTRRALQRAIAEIVVVLVLLMFAIRSFDQTKFWLNTEALMTHAIEVNPRSWSAYGNLGVVMFQNDRVDEALAAQQISLSLHPFNPAAHLNIGEILLERGKLPEATREFETALHEQRSVQAHVNLANAYGQVGRFDDAIVQYKLALELSPDDKKARRMLEKTQAYLRSKRPPATAPESVKP